MKKRPYCRRAGTNNTSGFVGIRLETRLRQHTGHSDGANRQPWIQQVYIAEWPGGRRQFSCKKYGEAEALRLAQECRATELEKLGLFDELTNER